MHHSQSHTKAQIPNLR